MLVCHCNAVNDRVIRELIATGEMDLDALIEHCGAGARCGGCLQTIQTMMESQVTLTLQPAAVA